MLFLFNLITSESILGGFLSFGKIQKSKMADQDGPHSDMISSLLWCVTSSPHDVYAKGDIFRLTICPPSLVVIAFIFSELRGGGRGGGGGSEWG